MLCEGLLTSLRAGRLMGMGIPDQRRISLSLEKIHSPDELRIGAIAGRARTQVESYNSLIPKRIADPPTDGPWYHCFRAIDG